MTDPKLLDWKTLREDGYLQEVNREFFHPLGLALGIKLHGGEFVTIDIMDARDDADGYVFNSDIDLDEKAKKLHDIREARKDARVESLGYWVQPASVDIPKGWQPIETAPKNEEERILVLLNMASVWVVHMAWWRDGAVLQKFGLNFTEEDTGWWTYPIGSVTQEQLDGYRTPLYWMPLETLPTNPFDAKVSK